MSATATVVMGEMRMRQLTGEATTAKTILVLAVTGSQGGATARHLLQQGWRVRGLTRNANSRRAQALARLGVELTEGNMGDRGTLDRALDGVHGVYAVTDFFRNGIAGEIQHGKLIADAAKSAGVQHFVFASVAAADRQTGIPHFDSKWQIEQHIERLGLPATMLRPTLFMEDLTDAHYGPIVGWGLMRRVIGQQQPVQWIAVDDIGFVAALVFGAPEAFIGRRLSLVGDTRSLSEARTIFKTVDGKAPFGVFMPARLFGRMVSDDLLTMWKWLSHHTLDADAEIVRKLHPGVMTMEMWLRGKRSAQDGK